MHVITIERNKGNEISQRVCNDLNNYNKVFEINEKSAFPHKNHIPIY